MIEQTDPEFLCPRCANGKPICADGYSHNETCATYKWSVNVCDECLAQIEGE